MLKYFGKKSYRHQNFDAKTSAQQNFGTKASAPKHLDDQTPCYRKLIYTKTSMPKYRRQNVGTIMPCHLIAENIATSFTFLYVSYLDVLFVSATKIPKIVNMKILQEAFKKRTVF